MRDIQQFLRDEYSLQTKNQELIQTVRVLLCENEKYRQDLEAAHQSYQLAQYASCAALELLTDACVKTKALEPQLRFPGYTIDHLNGMSEDGHAADEMESLCRSYRQFLADKMDIVSEVDDGGDAMWRAASYLANLERDLDALIDGEWSDCGLDPVLRRNPSIMFEAQTSRGANGANAQMQEDSESEYEPPETIRHSSIPIPPGGHPSLGEGQMFASGTQPLCVTRWVGLSESDAGQNDWFHLYGTETQDTFMFNDPQNPAGQPKDPHTFILDVELTQASQETFDCAMLYALPTQD
ncbi:hypothetical protein BDV38DRAFT_275390 [Aspergillus pseudotamarii]|uniref:Uncharacterized protein n=1 Tax=Aspergillus pseudotamarii TaxID=132259 RepID=A0A5N6SBP3_ASPPS|nr:uncharacterized protein BDV38DRAFT_275390 [Aspergillus pseudotamarii]KAE8132128.1 hypothetical protein BDV38DRAFT_275390 [Aspergillus pseudotamarii]